MEIAKKDVKVTLTNGKEIDLSKLTKEDLPNVVLDGKDGKSITLKRCLISETETQWVERRLFKYADNDKRVVYDLPLPKTDDEAVKMFTGQVADFVVKAVRVESDHAQVAGEGLSQEVKSVISLLKKADKGENLNESEKAIIAKWYQEKYGASQGKVNEVKKGMKEHGFAK